jgi:HK97 family phage major capsid protein
MPALTEAQREAAQKQVAKELVEKMNTLGTEVPEMKKSLESLGNDVKRLMETNENMKGLDVKKTLELVEQIRASQQQIKELIRTHKGGIYVPGLGDNMKEKFSLMRAMTAVAKKDWSDASYEERVMKEAREAVLKGPGAIVGVDSQGGFFVPDQVIPDVIQAIYAQSVLLSLDGTGTTRVGILDGLTGIPVTIPKFVGGMIAYWIGEQDRYVETQSKVGNISMSPKKLGVLTRITDEMKRFSSFGFEALTRKDMVKAAAALIDYTILYGTGTQNMPRGIVALGASDTPAQRYSAETHSTTFNNTVSGGELGYDDLMNMQGLVEDLNIPIDPSWAWISHPRYFRRRRQDKIQYFSGQTSNFGYLVDGPMMAAARLRDLIGDYGTLAVLPTTNTAGQSIGAVPTTSTDKTYGDVFGANWNDVLVGRWGGVEILEDNGLGRGFPNDETYVKMRMYMDTGFRREQSVVHSPDVKMR